MRKGGSPRSGSGDYLLLLDRSRKMCRVYFQSKRQAIARCAGAGDLMKLISARGNVSFARAHAHLLGDDVTCCIEERDIERQIVRLTRTIGTLSGFVATGSIRKKSLSLGV